MRQLVPCTYNILFVFYTTLKKRRYAKAKNLPFICFICCQSLVLMPIIVYFFSPSHALGNRVDFGRVVFLWFVIAWLRSCDTSHANTAIHLRKSYWFDHLTYFFCCVFKNFPHSKRRLLLICWKKSWSVKGENHMSSLLVDQIPLEPGEKWHMPFIHSCVLWFLFCGRFYSFLHMINGLILFC